MKNGIDEEAGLKRNEINLDQIIVHSIDFNCNYYQYSAKKITHKIAILK